jgi:quinol monooxygenase YgiN
VSKTALFVRHRAKPGQRDEVRRVWEKYVKPRVEANPDHEAYFFCLDDNDPDVICVFQLYPNKEAMQEFLNGDWYSEYMNEVSRVVAEPPQIVPAGLVWSKGTVSV